MNIQSIAEKYLSQAVIENKADGGNVIIMNPSNGDILAMATYPSYNLNEPYKINNVELFKLDSYINKDITTIIYLTNKLFLSIIPFATLLSKTFFSVTKPFAAALQLG